MLVKKKGSTHGLPPHPAVMDTRCGLGEGAMGKGGGRDVSEGD